MFNAVFCIAQSAVYYLNASFSRLITSVGVERAVFFFLLSITRIFVVVFSVRTCSSSSGCLGNAVLFYSGTPWAFHITCFAMLCQML